MKYVALNKVDNNIIIHGDGCITTLADLYTVLADVNTTEIEIRKEFADKFFTYSALCDFVENVAAIAPNVRVYVEDAVYDTSIEAVQQIRNYKTPAEFVYALESKPTFVMSTIHNICDAFLQANTEATSANNKISTMLVQLDEYRKQLNYVTNDRDKLEALTLDLQAKLHALVSRVNFQYEKTINPDKMFISERNSYTRILYIKEITRIHYMDTLMYYLLEILKTMYGCPTRGVVIEPYYSYSRSELYPDFVPHWKLAYSDVYEGNILMCGFQPRLMNDILCNSNHVNYLVVLDRGGYMTPHITGNNVDVVYTCSDLADIPEDIPSDKVITYDESTLNIPYIEDFDVLSPEKKIQIYSSMDITKKLIKYLEEVN